MREAAARFNISNEAVVRHWVYVYKETGPKELLSVKSASRKFMTKPKQASVLNDAAWRLTVNREQMLALRQEGLDASEIARTPVYKISCKA